MSTNLESLIPARPATRPTLVVLSGFTAALCWWIVLVGVVNSGAGAIFLVVPVLATIATFRAARRQSRQSRHHKAQHVNQSRRHRARRARSAHRGSMVILYGFTAALCWWIGIAGVINSGGGAFFLIIPVLATAGTLLAARYKGRAPKTYAT